MDRQDSDKLLKLMKLIFNNGEIPVQPEQIKPYLNQHMRMRKLKKSELIVGGGQVIRYIHIILTGGAYIMRHTASGTYTTIARVPAPSTIGFAQIFSKDPVFYSDIVTSSETLLLEIEHRHYYQCVAQNADLALLNLTIMSEAQKRNSTRLEVAHITDSTDKLLVYLYRHWAEKGMPEKTIRITEKHAIIASDVGISLRTLYRCFNKLEHSGLLVLGKGGVLIITYEQLQEIARLHRQVTVQWD